MAPTNGARRSLVTLKDGRRLSRRVDQLVGRGGDDPMSSDEIWEKF